MQNVLLRVRALSAFIAQHVADVLLRPSVMAAAVQADGPIPGRGLPQGQL